MATNQQPVQRISSAAMGRGSGGGGGMSGPQMAQQMIASFAQDQSRAMSKFVQSASQVQEAQQRQAAMQAGQVTSAMNQIIQRQDEKQLREEGRAERVEEREFQQKNQEWILKLTEQMKQDQEVLLRRAVEQRQGGKALIDSWTSKLADDKNANMLRRSWIRDWDARGIWDMMGPKGMEYMRTAHEMQRASESSYENRYHAPFAQEVNALMAEAVEEIYNRNDHTDITALGLDDVVKRLDIRRLDDQLPPTPTDPVFAQALRENGGYPAEGMRNANPDNPNYDHINMLDPRTAMKITEDEMRMSLIATDKGRQDYVALMADTELKMREHLGRTQKFADRDFKMVADGMPRSIARGLDDWTYEITRDPNQDMVGLLVDKILGSSLGLHSDKLIEASKEWEKLEDKVVDTEAEYGVAIRVMNSLRAAKEFLVPTTETQPGEDAIKPDAIKPDAIKPIVSHVADQLMKPGYFVGFTGNERTPESYVVAKLLADDQRGSSMRQIGAVMGRQQAVVMDVSNLINAVTLGFAGTNVELDRGDYTASTRVALHEAIRHSLIGKLSYKLDEKLGLMEEQPYHQAVTQLRASNTRLMDVYAEMIDSVGEGAARPTLDMAVKAETEGWDEDRWAEERAKGPEYFQMIMGPAEAMARLVSQHPSSITVTANFLAGNNDSTVYMDNDPQLMEVLKGLDVRVPQRVQEATRKQRERTMMEQGQNGSAQPQQPQQGGTAPGPPQPSPVSANQQQGGFQPPAGMSGLKR